MRLIHTILILMICVFPFCVNAVHYLPETQLTISEELFRDTYDKAERNLAYLPKHTQNGYSRLLKENPDVLMAFLIAYEYDAVLAESDPMALYDNYLMLREHLRTYEMPYNVEMFLSYIAKQTVTDERLEAYRRVFLDSGLRDIMNENPDPLELYRAVSLWCLQRLQFRQTSGRDQTPLDIIGKSLIGRCEEMQILFVAACRVVGLPSRPASTPYWAHMDNNHAWAEVYLNGEWRYTGDMDAAYYPDQTWFSGMIDKTVLILARASLPDENDEVLAEGIYGSVINSTPNYAKDRTRQVSITVMDEAYKPVSDATVNIMVYNWSSLRSIMTLKTDSEGQLSFSTGRGAFYLLIQKEDLVSLDLVESSDQGMVERKIILGNKIVDTEAILEYPANEMIWSEAPEHYREQVFLHKNLWQKELDGFGSKTEPAFADSLYLKVRKLCHNNYQALDDFARKYRIDPQLHGQFYQFLSETDPKFLWQATPDQIAALHFFYRQMIPVTAKLADREKYSLLSPTVHYEELSLPFYQKKIPALYPKSFITKGRNDAQVLKNLNRKLAKKYQINSNALTGLLRLDVAFGQKVLQPYQYKILFCSALKANGIPAEYTRIPDVINVYIEGRWQYYNIIKAEFADFSTAQPSGEKELRILYNDEDGLPVSLDESQSVLSQYRNGLLYPMNQQFRLVEDGSLSINLPTGEYYLQTGYRISDSATYYRLDSIEIRDDTSDHILKLSLQNFPRSWQEAESLFTNIVDELGLKDMDVVIIGNQRQENSLRIADQLRSLGMKYALIGYEESATDQDYYYVSKLWREKCAQEINRLRTITLFKGADGKWQMFEGRWDRLPK